MRLRGCLFAFVAAFVGFGWPTISAAGDETWLEKMQQASAATRTKWPEIESTNQKMVAEACANHKALSLLKPKPIYVGGVAGVAVSRTGILAIADLQKGALLIFSKGSNQPLLPAIRIQGFRWMAFSVDGRFLAYSDGFRFVIFDVASKSAVASWDQADTRSEWSRVRAQWMGESLLIGSDKGSFRLVWNGTEFRRENLADFGQPWHDSNFERYAYSDQLGASFLRGEKLYPDVNAAISDNAIAQPQDSFGWAHKPLFRAGSHLLQIMQRETGTPAESDSLPWLLVIRDGRSGEKIRTLKLPNACAPTNVAVPPDDEAFAVQFGLDTVVLFDSGDLSVRAVYGLKSQPLQNPQSLAFISNAQLLTLDAGDGPNGTRTVSMYSLPGPH